MLLDATVSGEEMCDFYSSDPVSNTLPVSNEYYLAW